MQILNQQCLLNAAGMLLAGRCHSMVSYNACGFVVIRHLCNADPRARTRVAFNAQSQDYEFTNPRIINGLNSSLPVGLQYTSYSDFS